MEVLGEIVIIVLLVLGIYLIIVGIPILFGKIFLGWSNQRISYIFSNSMATVISSVVVSLIVTGIALLIGIVFNQPWAFSGGLLILYMFWITIKSVYGFIKESRRM